MKTSSFTVGIVGATGAVGQELLQLLAQRNFPVTTLRLFASARSAGKIVEFAGKKITIEEARPGVFGDIDVAFFAVSRCVGAAPGVALLHATSAAAPASAAHKRTRICTTVLRCV